jgi:hypothetical protein
MATRSTPEFSACDGVLNIEADKNIDLLGILYIACSLGDLRGVVNRVSAQLSKNVLTCVVRSACGMNPAMGLRYVTEQLKGERLFTSIVAGSVDSQGPLAQTEGFARSPVTQGRFSKSTQRLANDVSSRRYSFTNRKRARPGSDSCFPVSADPRKIADILKRERFFSGESGSRANPKSNR